jgi:hypothetical protein
MTMKKLLLIFTFVLPLLAVGQNWSPAGATWYYGFSVWTTEGYYKIEYVGDSTINAILCKKLLKTVYWQDLAFMTSDTIVIGTEYTYADSNKVYIYKHNQFYTLYDFSAQVGNTWTVPEIKHYSGCDTVGTIQVDSIGTMIINSQTLRYICVSLADTSKWGWSAKIVERVGPIKPFSPYYYDYLFPVKFDFCGMVLDELIEGGNFRCYTDSTPFNYTSNIALACDFLTSVNSIDKNSNQVKVFPNPFSLQTNLHTDNAFKDATLTIYSSYGQQVKQILNISGQTITLHRDKLPSGLYFIRLTWFAFSGGTVARRTGK